MKKPNFYCDNCGKQQEGEYNLDKRVDVFPYTKEWIYLYEINFKVINPHCKTFKNKHFCSPECFTAFIRKSLHNEIDKYEKEEKN